MCVGSVCVCMYRKDHVLGVVVSRCIVEGFTFQCPFLCPDACVYTPHIIFEIHLWVCVCV